jgi:arginine decarboxylase
MSAGSPAQNSASRSPAERNRPYNPPMTDHAPKRDPLANAEPAARPGATSAAASPASDDGASSWSVDEAASHYAFADWGRGYFAVSDRGTVVVRPSSEPGGPEIDLLDVAEGLRERDISTPVLLRFDDIVRHTLTRLRGAFDAAIAENEYKGSYSAVYPIKVNQQRSLVEDVRTVGSELGFGLEVGSKPELLAVLALTTDSPEQLIICNGFKDDTYIEAVILATKLGRRIVPVIESFAELQLIIKHAQKYGVRPAIGVRVKLSSAGAGKWKDSSGSRSKFGVFVSELLDVHAELDKHGMLDCLQLLHCHIGSQVQDIRNVKDAVNELAQVYVRLVEMGAGLRYLDVGGGLGVDYTGAQNNAESSMNYSVEEYASDVVYRTGAVCTKAGVAHPHILSESGRAMVAFGSVLIVDVLNATGPRKFDAPADLDAFRDAEGELPQPIIDIFDACNSVREERLTECYHDAVQGLDAANTMFALGYLSLPLRALAERLYWATCSRIEAVCETIEDPPEELAALNVVLSDVYFCNFSVFQSLPDAWAIDQLFPITPIHRLEEEPMRRAILADITCDSDGVVDRFIPDRANQRSGPRATLDVHELTPGEPYLLGLYLVGAYQETLGDLHNLFGDTHVVHIVLDDDDTASDASGEGGLPGRTGWSIKEFVEGDTAAEVLQYMQYSPQRLSRMLQRDCERAVKVGAMTLPEARVLRRFFDWGLASYTYLESPADG